MTKKLVLIIIGMFFLIIGLFLTFGIVIYSLKENDNDVLYGYCLSVGLICFGIYSLVKGLRLKLK